MFVIRMVVDSIVLFLWRPRLNFKLSYIWGLAILYLITISHSIVRGYLDDHKDDSGDNHFKALEIIYFVLIVLLSGMQSFLHSKLAQ